MIKEGHDILLLTAYGTIILFAIVSVAYLVGTLALHDLLIPLLY